MSDFETRPQSYVGVSGIVSPSMQAQLEASATEAGLFEIGRLLVLGVKAVHKTQYLDIENKYGREWYPVGEIDFTYALRHSQFNINTIGVAQTYLDLEFVEDSDYRKEFTARIAKRGKPWIEAIQFDMLPWHNDSQILEFIEDIKIEHNLSIFLQCHNNAMTELGPKGVVRRLGHYASFIDYLLFDASHGKGKRLDTTSLDGFLEEAYSSEELKYTGLAVAGGLKESAVRQDMPTLVAKYPGLSWDAEAQLHPIHNTGKRPLDMQIVNSYLTASAEIIATA